MSTDKRSVHTDALETLGSIITENEKRDAIHLAVEPAVAAHTLYPGQDVGLTPHGKYGNSHHPVGIVDPFLKNNVEPGQRFWLIVYPRQITSLRHVWTHPEFPEAPEVANQVEPESEEGSSVLASRRWIESFAADLDQTYNRLMTAAHAWVDNQDYTYDNSEIYKDHWDKFPEFWRHFEIVTGLNVKESERGSFFACSC